MNTTDNEIVHDADPSKEAKIIHRNETGNVPTEDDNPTQEQINKATDTNPVLDEPDQQKLDATDEPTKSPIDGNGLREHTDKDVATDESTVEEATNADPNASQEEIAKREQDKQNAKLNMNTKPGGNPGQE